MSRNESPLTCCDRDCAKANRCSEGGEQCPDCGYWYCPVSDGDEDGRCDDCAERHKRELEEDEKEQEAEDGE